MEAKDVKRGMYVKTDEGEFILVRGVSHSRSGMHKTIKVLIALHGGKPSGDLIFRGTDMLEVLLASQAKEKGERKGTCQPPPASSAPGTSM